MMKNIYKKISILILVFVLIFSPLLPVTKTNASNMFGEVAKNVFVGLAVCNLEARVGSYLSYFLAPAESVTDLAKVPVSTARADQISSAKASKECTLDYAANQLKSELILGIVRSTTEWVKGGFNGEPAFITNPDQFLTDATDKWVGKIIESNKYTKVLCSNFRIPLKFAINLKFYSKGKNRINVPTCTLSDVEQNMQNALGDLANFYGQDGGLDVDKFWNSFINVSTNDSNNAYGAYIELSDDLERVIGEENRKKLEDVNRGKGFMSVERCEDANSGTYTYSSGNNKCGSDFENCLKNAGDDEKKQNGCQEVANRCIKNNSSSEEKNCHYVTPGRIVADQVSDVLGMDRRNLELADEFDELITALITQLLSKIFDPSEGLSDLDSKNVVNQNDQNNGINEEKKALLRMYNPKAYDLEIKMYSSIKKTLTNFLDYATNLKDAWNNKKSEFDKNSDEQIIYRKEDGEYQKLISSTIDSNIEMLDSEIDSATDRLAKIENKIKERTETKEIVVAKIEELKGVKNKKDLWNLFVDEKGNRIKEANISETYNYFRNINNRYDKKVNGNIVDYEKTSPLRTGGIILSEEYLNSFNRTKCVIDSYNGSGQMTDCATNSVNSEDWYRTKSRRTIKYNTKIIDSYDPMVDIEEFTNSLNENDEVDYSNSEDNGINIDEQYYSIISKQNPSRASGENIINWNDFFGLEEKIVLDPNNQKDGKKYLAFVKRLKKGNKYDKETKSTYDTYNYTLYQMPVNHFALYPNGMGDDKVNDIPGQGRYKTVLADDGVSWESYRVFIPPFAKKVALLFKNNNEDDYLYRMHLTYGPNIDHRNVKTLEYKDKSSDNSHSSLNDLFVQHKTVLVNLLKYNGPIGSELKAGVNNMGIVLGETEIKKYIGQSGGWLYIDIIKDNYALGEKPVKKTYLDLLYYVDMDRNSTEYKNWAKKADEYLKPEEVNVAGIDKD